MRQTIQEVLGLKITQDRQWPVIEAGSIVPKKLIVFPGAKSIREGKQCDPLNCALALEIPKMLNLPKGVKAAIGGRWAYLPMTVMHRGKLRSFIWRAQGTADTQRAIIEWDGSKENMPEAGFSFIPIAPAHQAERKRLYNNSAHGRALNKASKERRAAGKRVRSYTRHARLKLPTNWVVTAPRWAA